MDKVYNTTVRKGFARGGFVALARRSLRVLLGLGLGFVVMIAVAGQTSAGPVNYPGGLAAADVPHKLTAGQAPRPLIRPLIATTLSGPTDPPPGGYTFLFQNVNQAPLLTTAGQEYDFSQIQMRNFDSLYWGPADTTSYDIGLSVCSAFTFDSSQPDLANGIAHWSATTNTDIGWGTYPCTFTLTVTSDGTTALPLIDSSSLGLTQNVVVQVPANGAFVAKMHFSINGQSDSISWIDNNRHANFSSGSTPPTHSDFNGGFFYKLDAPAVAVQNVSVPESGAFGGTVATITDADKGSSASEYTATIAWGDGNTSSGTVTGSTGGPFTITGNHTWADEGSFPVTVAVTDSDNSNANVSGSGTATVAETDALSAASSIAITTASSGNFSGPVASFTDGNTATPVGDLSASIDWGDGTTTSGTVSGSSGNFSVTGSHVYIETGKHSMTVMLSDDTPGSATATATGTSYFYPTANPDSYSTYAGQTLNVGPTGVLGNDNGTSLAASLFSAASNGTATVNSDGSFSYAPNPGFSGSDSFQYEACDTLCSSPATVSVTVYPVANADAYTTPVNQNLFIGSPGLLGNDLGSGLTVRQITSVANGILYLNPDGSFTYKPASGFSGTDGFQYEACTGLICSTAANVTISVTPIANPDSYQDVFPGYFAGPPGVLGNDAGSGLTAALVSPPSDMNVALNPNGSFQVLNVFNHGYVPSDTMKYQACSGSVCSTPTTITFVFSPIALSDSYGTTFNHSIHVLAPGVLSNDLGVLPFTVATEAALPNHGTVSLNHDGSFTYTPTTGFTGADSFAYTMRDSRGMASAPATVNIQVSPLATAHTYSTSANTTLNVIAPGVLQGCQGNGTLSASLAIAASHGSVTINANGSFTYSSAAGFSGNDQFFYKVTDSNGISGTAGVLIHVKPLAVKDKYTASAGSTLTVAAPGVLSNDIGIGLTGSLVSAPTHGSLTFNSDGSFSYTPNANYSGPDSFKYKVTDSTLLSSAATTVTLTVRPTAVADSYAASANTPLEVPAGSGMLANDIGTGLILQAVHRTPAHGIVTFSSDGSFTYTPTTGFTGTDTFTYACRDSFGTISNTVVVTIVVS